jgi:hypothetical protein
MCLGKSRGRVKTHLCVMIIYASTRALFSMSGTIALMFSQVEWPTLSMYLHVVYILSAVCLHFVSCLFTFCHVYTFLAVCLHFVISFVYTFLAVCFHFVSCLFTLCQLFVYTLSAVYLHFVSCLFTLCQLFVYTLSAVCLQFVSCLFTHCYILCTSATENTNKQDWGQLTKRKLSTETDMIFGKKVPAI